MVIPKSELDFETDKVGIQSLTHRKAKVKLEVFPPSTGASGQVFLSELDGLGNVKKSTAFSGVLGFWEATKKFEEIIAKALNLQEVVGFEVGMVIEVMKDTANLNKGDKVIVLEVNNDGKATKFRKIQNQEIDNIKNSPYFTPLIKSDDLGFLRSANLTNLDMVEPNTPYAFDFNDVDIYELPRRFNYRNYNVNEIYQDPQDGENYTIRSIAFQKQPLEAGETKPMYMIGLMVLDKDGVLGWKKLF